MKKSFSNTIYGVDIETSTADIDSENKCAFMYSFCFGNLNLDNGEYNDLLLGRTYEDLDNYLDYLNNLAIKQDTSFIVYIHNFSYEFSFFINNLKFFKKYNEIGGKNHLFLEKNKPLYVTCDHLQFRCSYLLLDKSISAIGKQIGLEKLDYNYNQLRTPLTELEDKEIAYNFRDVEIMLKGVESLYRTNVYIQSANDLPNTKTGIMRFNCERNPEVNVKREYVSSKGDKKKGSTLKLNKFLCNLEKASSLDQLKLWETIFQGGLVYSNPKYIGTVLKKVGSFDFASDYPFQMLTRLFPSQFVPYNGDKKKKLLKLMQGVTEKNLIAIKPLRSMFNATITIREVKAKYDFEPIGTAKVQELDEPLRNTFNCLIINGKIKEIKPKIRMNITCIDMITLYLFYDLKIESVEYLEIATRYRYTNEYKLNAILYNAKAKIEYKKYDSLVSSMNEYHIYTEDEITNNIYRDLVNKEQDYYSQLEVSHSLYQAVKSDLNALYGDNAQHLLHVRISYDTKAKEWICENDTYEDYMKGQYKTSYIYGLYVPQYARASILYIAYNFIKEGLPIMYIDTDSIKTIDCPLAHQIVEEFNKLQYDSLGPYKWTRFGQLEHEYTADKFSSLGTKSYIKLEDGKVKATISGLPHASKIYAELLDYYEGNFEEMIAETYHYGVKIAPEVTTKLASVYKHDTYDIDIDGYVDTVTSGVVLVPCEVTMRDFTSKTWYTYAHIICDLYNRDMDMFCKKTQIIKNNKGKLEVRYG